MNETTTREMLIDFLVDIDLLDSNAAFDACAAWSAQAYGLWASFDDDGLPVQIALVN